MRRRNHKPQPQRTCLGCRGRDAKDRMLRLVADGSGVAIDHEKRMPGRGGYLHPEQSCLTRFTRSKVKEFRSLKRQISFDERLRITELILTWLDRNATLS